MFAELVAGRVEVILLIVKSKKYIKYVVWSNNCIYEKDNFHYLPEFSTSLLKLLRTYLLWSAIIIKHFNVNELTASSSSVDSYFNDLKNRSFHNDNLPLRVDKFVCKHIKEIDGMLKIANHDEIFTIKIKEPDEIETNISKEYYWNNFQKKNVTTMNLLTWSTLHLQKSMKTGRGWLKKKKSTSYYAAPNPEIMHIEHTKKIEIALIKNGNFDNKTKATKLYGESIILTNTCPYDSIIQAISCAYCDSQAYSNHIDTVFSSVVIYRIVKYLITEGYSKNFKIERVDLLKNICPSETLVNYMISINCSGNISSAYEKICEGIESVTEYYKCSVCSFEWNNKKKVIYLVIQNFKGLEDKLKKYFNDNIKYRNCFHQNELSVDIGKQIFIDCDLTKASIMDLPIILNIKTKLILRSAIIYSGTPNTIGHYYTVCRRNDGAWETYNDMQNKVTVARTSV